MKAAEIRNDTNGNRVPIPQLDVGDTSTKAQQPTSEPTYQLYGIESTVPLYI